MWCRSCIDEYFDNAEKSDMPQAKAMSTGSRIMQEYEFVRFTEGSERASSEMIQLISGLQEMQSTGSQIMQVYESVRVREGPERASSEMIQLIERLQEIIRAQKALNVFLDNQSRNNESYSANVPADIPAEPVVELQDSLDELGSPPATAIAEDPPATPPPEILEHMRKDIAQRLKMRQTEMTSAKQ